MFKEVYDNIYMVSPGEGGSFPSSYCFYIDDDIKTLIDTPLDEGFYRYFTQRSVDMVINTHFHRDHSGCNHLFPDAKIMIHPDDAPAINSIEKFIEYYGIKEHGDEKMETALRSWLKWKPSHITSHINNGDVIDLGKTKLEVIHTPGHTPGHCVFYWPEKGIIFTGDIDLTGFGPWYGNAVSDVDHFINSIERLISLNPQLILSGHKGVIDKNPELRLKKYLNKLYDNEERILSSLKSPQSLEELTNQKIIYGRWGKPDFMFFFFEKVSLINHLQRLERIGLVNKEKDGRYIAAV